MPFEMERSWDQQHPRATNCNFFAWPGADLSNPIGNQMAMRLNQQLFQGPFDELDDLKSYPSTAPEATSRSRTGPPMLSLHTWLPKGVLRP